MDGLAVLRAGVGRGSLLEGVRRGGVRGGGLGVAYPRDGNAVALIGYRDGALRTLDDNLPVHRVLLCNNVRNIVTEQLQPPPLKELDR